jgi:two-component system response regulator RegA
MAPSGQGREEMSASGVERPPPALGQVLVVDDPEWVSYLTHALRLHGYDGQGVCSAGEALRAVERASWDAVLLELGLSEASALDLLAGLLQRDPLSNVIVIRGRDEAQPAIDALRAGAQSYLTQSASIEQLLGAVEKACERRRLGLSVEVGPRLIRLEDVIRKHVLQVFHESHDNVTRTALALGISRVALRRRLREYGAKPQPIAPASG